jgi:cysteine desulfurase
VLKAMGVEGELGGLRVSIGRETGEPELAAFRAALAAIIERKAARERAA